MKLVVIFGPAAVGKMTVGYELQKICEYKLFHNHMVLEPVYNFFGYGDKQLFQLTGEFRTRMFEEFGKSSIPGIIFTYVWALDMDEDHQELLGYMKSMNVGLEDVLFVELEADQETRVKRNKSDFRLSEKKSKNNTKESERFIYEADKRYLLNSNNGFFYPQNHLKINNCQMAPDEAALLIHEELIKRGFSQWGIK